MQIKKIKKMVTVFDKIYYEDVYVMTMQPFHESKMILLAERSFDQHYFECSLESFCSILVAVLIVAAAKKK